MQATAKLFTNGGSQAVRLPVSYRFEEDEVFIRKDTATGDLVISRKPSSWDDFFTLQKTMAFPQDYMDERDNDLPQERDLF